MNWLVDEPYAYAIPSIRTMDKIINIFSRFIYISLYISLRLFLRIILGKNRRDKKIQFYHKLRPKANVSFSFYMFMYLYKLIRFLRLGNPLLIKIDIPKYNYKIYCPATEEDYGLMTAREKEIIEYFQPDEDDIVIDVGAYLGRYTLISSNKVGDNGKVIAIEAYPQVFECLKKNIKLNQSNNIIPLNYAIFSEDEQKIKLFLREESIDTIYSPHNTLIHERNELTYNKSKTGRFLNVNTKTLDSIVSFYNIDLQKLKWIKIDVEGAELEVLKGAHNILSKSKDLSLLIEVHLLDLNKNKSSYESIMDLLKQYNFKLKVEKFENAERHIILNKK
jgi:FkbM family methyltransferase